MATAAARRAFLRTTISARKADGYKNLAFSAGF
jgi:hypothetical protein